MKIIVNPEREDWSKLTVRSLSDDESIGVRVAEIVERVRKEGDKALSELSAEIDGLVLDRFEVPVEEIASAAGCVDEKLKKAIETAAGNIEKFHRAQLRADIDMETMSGVRCVQRSVPVQTAGLYVPGGSAPLFSTVLMLAIPAKAAGCPRVVLCSPPQSDGRIAPEVLYAASVCGVDQVFRTGGAQAVAAMAYGTESIPRVDKIFGPGNRYVTQAKQLVSVSQVAIDMPAGPSEVMVMADHTAVPEFVAADMLSQAEHGPDSQAILLTDSYALAEQVSQAVEDQLAGLSRAETTARALTNSRIIVLDDRNKMVDFANVYAAEHLIVSMSDPWEIAGRITCAGSIFIGNYSPESAGDYASGSNHTLPTAGWANAYSGVNTGSFMKKITVQELTREGLAGLGGTIMTMAEAEGLDAHRNAVQIRLENDKRDE